MGTWGCVLTQNMAGAWLVPCLHPLTGIASDTAGTCHLLPGSFLRHRRVPSLCTDKQARNGKAHCPWEQSPTGDSGRWWAMSQHPCCSGDKLEEVKQAICRAV